MAKFDSDEALLAALDTRYESRSEYEEVASAAAARIRELLTSLKVTTIAGLGQKWRHRKRGGTYWVFSDEGVLQCSGEPPREGTRVVSYMDHETYRLYHRPYDEFNDGRFEHLPDRD